MATSGYDGSIKVDTKIDDKSFNNGMSKLSASIKTALSKVGSQIMSIAATAATVASVIASIGAGLLGVAAAVVLFGIKLINEMSRAVSRTNEYGKQIAEIEQLFADVKGAVYAAFSPLIEAALPYIKIVVNWLVNMLNTVSMIVAAFLGQSTVMQYIAGSADTIASKTGQMAGNTQKTEKAAKGALAAFDDLNVLAKDTADNAGGGAAGGAMQFQTVPVDVDAKWAELAEKIKTIWGTLVTWIADNQTAFWAIAAAMGVILIVLIAIGAPAALAVLAIAALIAIIAALIIYWPQISAAAADAWAAIVNVWNIVASWFQLNVIDPVVTFFTGLWASISQLAGEAWDKIVAFWGPVIAWYMANVITPLVTFFTGLWNTISAIAKDAWLVISLAWGIVSSWYMEHVITPLATFFSGVWETIKVYFWAGWAYISAIWGVVSSWFQLNVIDPVQTAFGTALDWIKTKWEAIFTGVKDFVKGIVNGIIGLINSMISGMVGGINHIISSANALGDKLPGWTVIPALPVPQIPLLATGAVIPPNAPFLAAMGDQRNGRNLEAPEDLIRQIVREETANSNQAVTVNFTGTMAALVRAMNPIIEREKSRTGTSLLAGGSIG